MILQLGSTPAVLHPMFGVSFQRVKLQCERASGALATYWGCVHIGWITFEVQQACAGEQTAEEVAVQA